MKKSSGSLPSATWSTSRCMCASHTVSVQPEGVREACCLALGFRVKAQGRGLGRTAGAGDGTERRDPPARHRARRQSVRRAGVEAGAGSRHELSDAGRLRLGLARHGPQQLGFVHDVQPCGQRRHQRVPVLRQVDRLAIGVRSVATGVSGVQWPPAARLPQRRWC